MPVAQTRLETLQVCKLLQCVRMKERDKIEKMTVNGIPHLINYNDASEGLTALGVAAAANDDEMIEFLLELGAHPDVPDFKGRTAAMRAAEFGHVQCLEKLTKAGADMKSIDLEGKGILFYCISPTERHAKCLESAVLNGAEPNNVSREGIPVFMFACETAAENEDACLLLLEKGSDPNGKQEKTGKTCLMAAALSGSVKVVRAILDAGGDVNVLDIQHTHAAHYAALTGGFEVLACMSAYGAEFDQCNNKGNTPIHNAALNGHAMCCKFLSQRGCNPKPKNNDGETAKSLAKEKEHKEAGKELRKAEKSFGKVGKNNEPWAIVLYDWVMERSQKLLNAFKRYDPDEKGTIQKDEFSDTLVGMTAPAEEADISKVMTLHDKARDGNIDYNDFFTGKKWINKNYLMSAFEGKKKKKKKGGKGKGKKGKFKLAMPICTSEDGPRTYGGAPPEMFIERHIHFTDTGRFDRDRPPKHPLQDDSAWYLQQPEKMYININDATKNGDFDSLKGAFQRGTPVDTRDKYYKTPLMVACAIGNIDMVKFLLESGAYINARDNFKWTPLHHACHSGQLDVVSFLLDNGAELEAHTMNGGTALTRAIESSREGLVTYLVDRGAKLQTENKKGHAPLDIANAWADPRVLEFMQSRCEGLPTGDKKGKGKGKGKGGQKSARPTSVPPPDKENTGPIPFSASGDDLPSRQRKGSILRAASALASGVDEEEDITYVPLKAWTKQPTSQELIHEKQVRRDRYGWEVDFPDFEMPFLKNVTKKNIAMGDDDD
ncbi:ankyrin repeat and EF-hand domain-containing protein 1-like isoform X2 [Pecten maximus]|uniref:ankyrin repeat and EF-hand domain-containing protein 1-like isoform X2 n=1 Tax=Pecten maximus TaxID=6579 RepID=UPI001458B748|nr:ankyrin repeat and EF-hand domain-containing protein 1-like isoform X2 [Pecten maximus]